MGSTFERLHKAAAAYWRLPENASPSDRLGATAEVQYALDAHARALAAPFKNKIAAIKRRGI